MTEAIALLNLTHLRFRGPDAERYLNGQITQQVENLPLGHSRYTFVCDAKGRILFDGTVHRDEEGLLLSIQGGESEEQFTRMDRYLIADDCELIDESERWDIIHELSEKDDNKQLINRFGSPGKDHYQEKANMEEALKGPNTTLPSAEQEHQRILHTIPRGPDLVGAFPAETGLEAHAVSFHKGCYLGQEVVSRMKRAGKTNRKLSLVFLSETSTELPLLFTEADSEKTRLEITSVATTATEKGYPALGYLNTRVTDLSILETPSGIKANL